MLVSLNQKSRPLWPLRVYMILILHDKGAAGGRREHDGAFDGLAPVVAHPTVAA